MKRGFTLIELLAVIVILAIISLIAVPIVINIINDSKTTSDEQSVELYLDTVEKIITKKQLNNPNFNPDKCEIQDNGDLKCYKNNELIDTVEIEMKGKMPEDGIIQIENNKFKFKNILFNNKIYYKSYASLIQDNNNNGKLDIGDKYTYKVNDKDTFNFYVLSFNEDDTVNLIMDRNICSNGQVTTSTNKCSTQWHKVQEDNNYGPDTVMTNLYKATKDWLNVPDMIMNYYDENNKDNSILGYKNIITNLENKATIITGKQDKVSSEQSLGNITHPLKARIPTQVEMRAVGCREIANSCPEWIFYDSNINGYGYWLLSSLPNDSSRGRIIYNNNSISKARTVLRYGIRPVITVPIEELSS